MNQALCVSVCLCVSLSFPRGGGVTEWKEETEEDGIEEHRDGKSSRRVRKAGSCELVFEAVVAV